MLGDRGGEHLGGHVAAVADQLLAGPAPRPVADGDAAEPHHRVHAIERARVDARGRWVPAALVGGGRGTPNQAEDVVSRRTEVGHEGGTDQTG